MATANAICLRFQVVLAAWATLLASLTAETKPVASIVRMPTTMPNGIALWNRLRQQEVAMALILFTEHRDVIQTAPSSYLQFDHPVHQHNLQRPEAKPARARVVNFAVLGGSPGSAMRQPEMPSVTATSMSPDSVSGV